MDLILKLFYNVEIFLNVTVYKEADKAINSYLFVFWEKSWFYIQKYMKQKKCKKRWCSPVFCFFGWFFFFCKCQLDNLIYLSYTLLSGISKLMKKKRLKKIPERHCCHGNSISKHCYCCNILYGRKSCHII